MLYLISFITKQKCKKHFVVHVLELFLAEGLWGFGTWITLKVSQKPTPTPTPHPIYEFKVSLCVMYIFIVSLRICYFSTGRHRRLKGDRLIAWSTTTETVVSGNLKTMSFGIWVTSQTWFTFCSKNQICIILMPQHCWPGLPLYCYYIGFLKWILSMPMLVSREYTKWQWLKFSKKLSIPTKMSWFGMAQSS